MDKMGEVGMLIEEGENLGRECLSSEGIGEVVGHGIVFDDVVPRRHGQRWMMRRTPVEFIVRRRQRRRRD